MHKIDMWSESLEKLNKNSTTDSIMQEMRVLRIWFTASGGASVKNLPAQMQET